MATLVDAVGSLKTFGIYDTILPFLLVAAGAYALLTKYKPFGDMKYVNAIISMVIGLVFISFAKAVLFINYLIPMMTIFLIMIVLVVLIFTFIGVKGETIAKTFQEEPAAFGILILIFLLITFVVIATVMPEVSIFIQNPELAQRLNMTPEQMGAGGSPIQQASIYFMFMVMQTILSPQILGLIAMVVVFAIAVYLITREK